MKARILLGSRFFFFRLADVDIAKAVQQSGCD